MRSNIILLWRLGAEDFLACAAVAQVVVRISTRTEWRSVPPRLVDGLPPEKGAPYTVFNIAITTCNEAIKKNKIHFVSITSSI